MRKLILLLFVASLALNGFAQQLPLFSQYHSNSLVYNPSHTGLNTGTSIALVARKQFTGIASPIGTYAATFQTRSEGKRGGFGLYVYNDDLNLFRTNSATGSYAYHVPLNGDKVLSFGLGLSVIDSRFNQSNFFLIDQDDPIVANLNNDGGIAFDANAGVNAQLGKLSLGLSSLQLLGSQETFTNDNNDKSLYTLANHWMFNAAYKIGINDRFNLEPVILYRKAPTAPGQVDLNLFLNWIDKGYAGLAYRDGMSISGMLGINLTEVISFGYAFDLTTHKFKQALGNTHEAMIKFNIGSKPSGEQGEVLAAKERDKYENRITDLEGEVETLKVNKSEVRVDTFVIEKTVKVNDGDAVVIAKEEKDRYESTILRLQKQLKELQATKSGVRVDTFVINKTVEVSNNQNQAQYEATIARLNREITSLRSNSSTVRIDTVEIVKEVIREVNTGTSTTAGTQQGSFYVIAGTFVNNSSANRYVSQLSAKGYSASIKQDYSSGKYYVYTSNYADKQTAIDYINRMKGSGLPLWIKSM